MKIAVQWTTQTPQDWEDIASQDWISTPSKPEPGLGDVIDEAKGWVHALNVQGVTFDGFDHYAIEDLGDAVRVICWIDAPGFDRQALEVHLTLLQPNQWGAWDTRQTFTHYAEGETLQRLQTQGQIYSTGGSVQVHPFDQFTPPDSSITRHGKGVPDDLHHDHCECRRHLCYDVDFLEGVPEEEIVDGKLRDQSSLDRRIPPDGTRTFYLTNLSGGTYTAHTLHSTNLFMDEAGDVNTDTTVTSANYSAAETNLEWAWTTDANIPGDTSWPSGTYVGQFRVTAAGGNMSFGWLSGGHLARINAAQSADVDSVAQSQSIFTGTGTHTGTASWTPGGSTATDRFEFLLYGERAAGGHGNQSFTVAVNDTTSFAEGPFQVITEAVLSEAAFFDVNAWTAEVIQNVDTGEDSANLQDTFDATETTDQDTTDEAQVQDTWAGSLLCEVDTTDSANIQDAFDCEVVQSVSTTDEAQGQDTFQATESTIQDFSDEAQGQDTWEGAQTTDQSVSEDFTIQDAWTGETPLQDAFLVEALQSQDTWAGTQTTDQDFSESFTIQDTWAEDVFILVQIDEGVNAGDSWVATGALQAFLLEAGQGQDTFEPLAQIAAALVDGATIEDIWTGGRTLQAALSEGAQVQDTLAGEILILGVVSESIQIGDTWTSEAAAVGGLSEAAQVSDVWAVTAQITVQVSEGALGQDDFQGTIQVDLQISESLTAQDNWTSALEQVLGEMVEAILAGDTLDGTVVIEAQVEETGALQDIFDEDASLIGQVLESFTISEIVGGVTVVIDYIRPSNVRGQISTLSSNVQGQISTLSSPRGQISIPQNIRSIQ